MENNSEKKELRTTEAMGSPAGGAAPTPQKGFWTTRRFGTKILAVFLAIACWLIVAMTDTTTQFPRDVENVPVNTEPMVETLNNMGLSIISISDTLVTAQVRGDRSTLSKLEPSALMATLAANNEVQGPGTYEFTLTPNNPSTQSMGSIYQLGGYTPKTISIQVDRLENRTLPLEFKMTGNTAVPDGFIREGETLTPAKIIVTGPKVELDKVAKAVVEVNLEQPLEKSYAKEHDIKLLDALGEEISQEEQHMTLDSAKAQVTIRVLKKDEVPLVVEFAKLPRGLNAEDIPFTMSNYEIAIAGPVEAVDRYNENNLGYIDIREVSKKKSEFSFNVELPDDFSNLENLETVTVSFDSSNWSEQIFSIPQDQIRILNASNQYSVSLVTEALYNVTIVGNKEIVDALKVEDIVVEVDLSEKEMSIGQYQHPVRISLANKAVAWATGEYSVVLQVQEAAAE